MTSLGLVLGSLIVLLTLVASARVIQVIPASVQDQQQDLLKSAEAREKAQEWTEAALLWDQIVNRNPTMPRYWNQLGRARLGAKDYRATVV